MESNTPTPNIFLNLLRIIHMSFAGVLILFLVYVYFSEEGLDMNFTNQDDIFLYVLPAFAVVSIFIGSIVFKKQLQLSIEKKSLKEKLSGYQSASLIRYAFVEAPALLAIVNFMTSRNIVFAAIAALLIGYFILLLPSFSRMEKDLNLSGEHLQEFRRSNEPIK